jgi:Cft2 family RNA processing exonuclease
MKTFKTHLDEATTPKDIRLGKYTFKYNKKDSDKDREWYDFTGVRGKYKDAFYITVSHDSKYAELNWVISDSHGDGNELIDWIRDVQQKTKAWTDEMYDDDEGQEKFFDKPIIGPMEKSFEKHFKKMGYDWDISS